MAILNHGSSIRTTDGGQTTSTIVTAANIGSYAVASNATYYIGTTQNVFNRASGAQTLTGVSIDGNAATVTNGVYTTGAQTIGGTKTFSDGVVVNGATYYTFNKPTTTNYQTVALFGSASAGLFLTTDSAIIGTGAYYNAGWIATATSGRHIDFAGGTFNFNVFSGATVGGTATWGSVATLNSSGTFSATGDFRAPVFYDTNNTAYYLDAASTSSFNALNLASTLAINGGDGIRVFKSPASSITSQIYWANGANTIAYNWQIDENNNAAMWGYGGTAWAKLLTITSGGNVGIGTTSPSYILDANSTNDNAIRIRNGAGSANNGLALSVGSGSPWLDIIEGVEFRIKGNTYANIGTWNSGNNTKLLINSSGNVGIGTTSPSQKLHVVGTGFASTDFRAPIFYDSDNTTYYLDPNASTSGNLLGVLKQNDGKFVRDSYFRTISGVGDYYASGASGWYTVASITLTTNCTGGVLYGTLYDNRYDGADTYQIAIVARAECDFTTNNESHYVNVGCTILGSTGITNYQSKIRVLLVASSTNSRTYEVQFFETSWNRDTWQLETGGGPVWTIYSTAQAPGTSTGTARVFYISNKNADNIRANTASYSPVYYDSDNTAYYINAAATSVLNAISVASNSTFSTDSHLTFGPNSTWGSSIRFGGNGYTATGTEMASVMTTDGNLHLDAAKSTNGIYLNWYGGTSGVFFGNGSAGQVGHVSSSGNASFSGSVTSTYGNFTTPGLIIGDAQYGFYVASGNVYYKSASGGVHYWRNIANSANTMSLDNGGILTVSGNVSAPIFYDSNDTSYYVDPSSTSRVSTLYVAGTLADSASLNGRIILSGNLHIDAYGAYDIYCNYYSGRRFRTFKGAGTGAEIFRTDTDGIVYAYEQLRTPILYDHNDTNYYLNPASSSVLNTLSMAGTITGALDATVSFTGGVCTAASYNYILNGANDTGNKLVIFVNGSTRTADGGVNALTIRNDGGAFVLGSASYLTSILGSSVTINGNAALTSASTLTAGNLSGTIPSGVLGNSTLYVGTTAIALNRGSASQTLTGTSIDGNAATATTATNSTQLGGVAAANYVRNDVDGSNSTALFRLTTITKSLTITTSWLDTGIVGADLSTGCYMISVYVDNYAVNGGHYQETYTGMMSWFSTATNSTDYDEIVLHKSGHASNGAYINLRTIRQLSGSTNLKLQIISSVSTNGASNYVFKFRRLI